MACARLADSRPRSDLIFKHILLPTDGSELSLRAVDAGIALAARLGADVYAFHVVDPYPELSYVVDVLKTNQEFFLQQAIKQAEGFLQEVHQRASVAGVTCKSGHVTGDLPYAAIVAAAVRQGCDLVVMASHGRHGVSRLLLGSETRKVLVSSQIPVLVCR